MAAIVQSTATNQGSAVTSITLTLSGVTAGNALVIEGAFSPYSATDSVVYPTGWTSAVSAKTPGGNSYAVLGVITGVAAGTQTITISSKLGSSTYWAIQMHEVSGLASSPVDSAAIATGTTTGTTLAMTSPAATTGASIAFSPLAYDNANAFSGTLAASSPWTLLWSVDTASIEAGAGADQVYTGASTPTITWSGMTADTVGWSAAIVPLLASGASPDNLGAVSASGISTALATLAFGVVIAGAALGIGIGSASLAQSQAFTGSARGSSLAVASASQSFGFTGSAQGSGSSQGALPQSLRLVGSSAGTGTASASVAQLQALAGVTDGAGIGTGQLTIPSASGLALSGQSYGSGSAIAAVAQYAPLAGSAFGTSFGSAQIAQPASLTGSANGARSSLASIAQSASFAGSAFGSANSSAPLAFGVSLSGTAIGAGSVAAILQSIIPSGYPAELGYFLSMPPSSFYVALAARSFSITASPRSFYTGLVARSFYAAIAPRSFYRMNNAMTPTFPNAIDPAETKVLTIDATADLASGVTLTSVIGSPIITVIRGYDTAAASRFTGAAVNTASIAASPPGIPVTIAAGKAVQIIATGLTDGATYDVRIVCNTTDTNNIMTLKGVLACTSL